MVFGQCFDPWCFACCGCVCVWFVLFGLWVGPCCLFVVYFAWFEFVCFTVNGCFVSVVVWVSLVCYFPVWFVWIAWLFVTGCRLVAFVGCYYVVRCFE